MQQTDISWATITWNPVTGCSHAGPECWNCYAETFSLRQSRTHHEWTPQNAHFNVEMHVDRLSDPFDYNWSSDGQRIFVGSMTDIFHPRVSKFFIERILDVVRHFPEHEWIFLTKRPNRAASMELDWPAHAWLGTSVGSGPGGKFADTTHRIDQLREADASNLWISFEPLIEPVGDVDLEDFDWIVIGGETGPDGVRRPMDPEWAADLYRQARDQYTAVWFKQHSDRYPQQNERLSIEEDGWYVQRKVQEFPGSDGLGEKELFADGGGA